MVLRSTSVITRRHQDLRRMRESYVKEGRREEFIQEVSEIFHDRSTKLEDFRLRGLFEALVDDGFEYAQYFCGPSEGGYRFQEAADVVNTSLFANIFGQYVYSQVLRSYDKPELIGDDLVTIIPTNLSGEKIPGVTPLGDVSENIKEGDPYPQAIFGENWIETPETIKKGFIVDVTKETLHFDKTGLILQRASSVGDWIAVNREKRILDVVLGIATVYKRNSGAFEATYQSDNTVTTTPLVDWTSVDAADTKYAGIVDPDTGEPIVSTPNTLIVPPALKNVAGRIRRAAGTWQTTSGRETHVNDSSLNGDWTVKSNQYVRARSGSDTTWFYGNPKAAFAYMQNWPITVESEGANGPQSFDRDIVARYKASERGAAGVLERRFMLKATA